MRLARAIVDGTVTEVADTGQGWVRLDAVFDSPPGVDPIIHALRDIPESRRLIRAADHPLPQPPDGFGPPITAPGKIIAVGLNYRAHAQEVDADAPTSPLTFAKYPSSIAGSGDVIPWRPGITRQLDYEVELAVVIGSDLIDADADQAALAICAYCVANDVSARDVQFSEGQWSRAKSFDGFCPLGPWLTTADSVDPQALRLTTTVNGEIRQDATTSEMIFGVHELVARLSRGTTLHAGDIILTGTPSGVAYGLPGQPWLQPGDVVRCEITGLGYLENAVAAAA